MPQPKAWSLSSELNTLEAAVEGARMLADLVAEDGASDEHDAAHAAAAASAMLELVCLRLRDLTRMLRGEMDADMLRGPHNECDADTSEPDVVFRSRR